MRNSWGAVFILFFAAAVSLEAVAHTDSIGFRGQKGYTALVEFTWDSEESDPLLTASPDGHSSSIKCLTFQIWGLDGKPFVVDENGISSPVDALTYWYLQFAVKPYEKKILDGGLDVGVNSDYPVSNPRGAYGPYLFGKSSHRGVLANDSWQPGEAFPQLLDVGRIEFGGVPEHAPEILSTLAWSVISFGAGAILWHRTKER